jgi:3-hydroxymyristoyl/3-hydroxydecanoyl-(acyl carrier protein) dehydratase
MKIMKEMMKERPSSTWLTIEATHPAFAGHFPGRPVLPGVALLAEVWEAALLSRTEALLTLDVVKFLSPVTPGMTLRIDLYGSQSGLRFEVFTSHEILVAQGRWSQCPSTARNVP